MLLVPALTPVTTPVVASTVAFDVLLLVHVPPAGEELSAVASPAHTFASPVMVDGIEFTVTSRLTAQPLAATPVTEPVAAFTVATAVLLLFHVPPPGPLVRVVDAPTQTEAVPVIPDGAEYTVMPWVTVELPQAPVTV
jgi:hypothetical protein